MNNKFDSHKLKKGPGKTIVYLPLFFTCVVLSLIFCSKKQPVGLITDKNEETGGQVVILPVTDSLQFRIDTLKFSYSDSKKQFYIVNATGDNIKWSIFFEGDWINAEPSSGAIAIGDSTKVEVTVMRAGLAEGEYAGLVSVLAKRRTYILPVVMSVYLNAVKPLDISIKDAEFSKQLNKIVAVDSQSNEAAIIDPETGTLNRISLSYPPICVSVSPDGMHAAVGHNGYVSYINLTTASVETVYPFISDEYRYISDIVLAGNGYVYVLPLFNQFYYPPVRVLCINLSNATVTQNTGYQILYRSKGRLHPSGMSIYVLDYSGISPRDLRKLSISGGTAAYLYDSPYHGDYGMADPICFYGDSTKIVTGGTVFRTSDTQSQDMIYYGAFPHYISSMVQSCLYKKILSTSGYFIYPEMRRDTLIYIYDDKYLGLDTTICLPLVRINDKYYRCKGDYVFLNADDSRYYAVVDADSGSALPRFGVVSFSLPDNKPLVK